MTVKKQIYSILTEAVSRAISDGALQQTDLPPVKVEYPRESKFGDYSSSFALEAARVLRSSPMQIGEILKTYIEQSEMIDRVDVIKPGFINIFISLDFMREKLRVVLAQNEQYGRNTKEKPRRIIVEFVSANPTGPMNIVSARAAAVGDTLANLFEMNGDSADREFYVNDFGNQVDLLGRSVLARIKQEKGEPALLPEEGYHGEYIKDIARHILTEHAAEYKRLADDEKGLTDFLSCKAVEYNVGGQKKDLEDFNVRFKTWFHERGLHEKGEVLATLSFLEKKGLIYDQEGKKVFKSSEFNDDKDRVVMRDDGRPTYFLADIAYHKNKIDRGYDTLIDIWGPDHHGYIPRLSAVMSNFGFSGENFRVLIAQQVNLVMEGETVKMSKRLGKFSTMRELINEIGVDVARFFFVNRSMDSHLDFDLALAKKQSSENPVFYLQYAHARICSIFREAEKRGIAFDPSLVEKGPLDNDESITLLKLLLKFPEEVSDSAESCEPHRIANYLLRLAQSYHRFYTEHRVLTDDKTATTAYLSLCDAVRIVIRNGLRILGVSAPEKM